MSHANMELQRFMSENGSVDATSMSESYNDPHSHPAALQHTDADTTQNPMYSSIPDANKSHQKFRATQLKQPSPSPVTTTNNSYSAPPTDGNPYDIIPDKSHRKGNHLVPPPSTSAVPAPGGVVTMLADNVLYAGTDEANEMHLRHKTLTMDKANAYQHYRGSVSPEGYEGDGAMVGPSGKRCCCWCLGGVASMLLVVALATGVLSLVIIFTGIIDVCKCNSAGDMQLLQDRILTLETQVQGLMGSPPTTATPNNTPSPSDTMTTDIANTATTMSPVTTPPPLTYPLEGVATLRDVDLFANCTTEVIINCTVETTAVRCETAAELMVSSIQGIILSFACIRSAPSSDSVNPFVTLLDINEGFVRCLCYVLVTPSLDPQPPRFPVKCGLQVTTCPSAVDHVISNFTLN